MTNTQTTAPLTRRQAREIERRTGVRPIAQAVPVEIEQPAAAFRHDTGRIERNALAQITSVVPTEVFDRQDFGKQLAELAEAQNTERGMTIRAAVPAALVAKRRRRTAVSFAAAASAAAVLSTGVLIPAAQSNQAADAHAADLAAATAEQEQAVAEAAPAEPAAEQVITEVVEAPAEASDRGDIASFDGGVTEAATSASNGTSESSSSDSNSDASNSGASQTNYNTPIGASMGNPYDLSQCTGWAFQRRMELGLTLTGIWGNANQWAYGAAADGYVVDSNPTVGAVAASQDGSMGHVAVVESVEPGVSVTVSEANWATHADGDFRTMSWGEAMGYQYIH